MNWWPFISTIINRVPIERVLFPPRDNIKPLEKFVATMTAPAAPNKAPVSENIASSISAEQEEAATAPVPAPQYDLPTSEETQEERSLGQDEAATEVADGTACLPCSRDHLSVTSSSLSEGVRFAREKGVRTPEVVRRIRIALDELNAMERIDLAPDETTKLKGAEKELADWTLNQSRNLRHAITAIKDAETMEKTAAKASQVTEEFMSRLWEIPEEECETCGEVRERLREFIERRKKEREGEG